MEKEEIASNIMRLKFPELFQWEYPEYFETIGPHFPDAFRDFEAKRKYALEEAYSRLLVIPPKILIPVHRKIINDSQSKDVHRYVDDALTAMRGLNMSPWFAGGFGVENKKADFSYWSKMGRLKLDEATAISIGFEPCGNIRPTDFAVGNAKDVALFYEKRRNLIASNFYMDISQTNPTVTPVVFCNWAKKVKLEIPNDLYKAVVGLTGRVNQKQEGELDPRERTSLLNLIATMANDAYCYDPSKRSEVPNEIYRAAQKNGIKLSKETIRNHLKKAVKPLEGEWKND